MGLMNGNDDHVNLLPTHPYCSTLFINGDTFLSKLTGSDKLQVCVQDVNVSQ